MRPILSRSAAGGYHTIEVNKYVATAFAASLLGCGCSARPKALVDTPKPGIIGQARFSTDDNSTTERVTFRTRITEPEVRISFQRYCRGQGLRRDWRAGATGIEWWQSEREYLGMLISTDPGQGTLTVTYFFRR